MKKVIITGGSRGLGTKIKKAIFGYDVYDISRTSGNFDKAQEVIVAHNPDIVIFNHGIWSGDNLVEVNLASTMRLAKQAWFEMLRTKKQGLILFILSNSAYYGFSGNEEYAATKAGLLGFARCLYETGRRSNPKISIATISPGTIGDTDFWKDATVDNRKNGAMQPEVIAEMVYQMIKSWEKGALVREMIITPC